MCRLVAYLGEDILLNNVLVTPKNSIVKQSLKASESQVPTNGDGFGIGWYVPKISPRPAIFHSIFPAWNDRNLLHITSKTESACFFAHVRAASVGGVNSYNCHPFNHREWMLMHNGSVGDFIAIKRQLRRLLDDNIYNWLKGETDSEHFFALFLQLAKNKNLQDSAVVIEVLRETFDTLDTLLKEKRKKAPSYYNVCLSDGCRLFATRYCTHDDIEPESLHYLKGTLKNQHGNKGTCQCVLIASEQLNDLHENWHVVPANHFVVVKENYEIELSPIK